MQLDGSYPTVTSVPLGCVKLEPVTVIVVPIAPDVGLLVIEGPAALTVKVLLLISTPRLLPLIVAHT